MTHLSGSRLWFMMERNGNRACEPHVCSCRYYRLVHSPSCRAEVSDQRSQPATGRSQRTVASSSRRRHRSGDYGPWRIGEGGASVVRDWRLDTRQIGRCTLDGRHCLGTHFGNRGFRDGIGGHARLGASGNGKGCGGWFETVGCSLRSGPLHFLMRGSRRRLPASIRHSGQPHRTSTFLNCHGSLVSISSGKNPGRSLSGVQSV